MSSQGLVEEALKSVASTISGTLTLNMPPLSRPINVIRWGIIEAAVAFDFGANTAMRLNKRITLGTDTGIVNGAGGSLVLTSTADAFTSAQTGLFCVVPRIQTTTAPLGPQGLRVNPGEQLQFEVTGAADAGTGHFWYQYEPQPFQKLSAHLVPPELANPDRLSNMTEQ